MSSVLCRCVDCAVLRPRVSAIFENGWDWFWLSAQFLRPDSDEWIEVVW